MGYNPVNWKDFPNEETPLSAVNLNHMDMQIKENADKLETPATVEKLGLVKPDGETLETDEEGKLRVIGGVGGADSTARKAISDNWQGKGYNLIPFPYFHDSRVINGITWTVNADGSVTANGTSTGISIFRLSSTSEDLKTLVNGKRYAISALCDSDDGYVEIYRATPTTKTVKGKNFTDFVYQNNENNTSVELYVLSGVTVSNITFHPMLVEVAEDGSYPTEYQRYADGNVELSNRAEIESARISDNWNKGYNLIPFPYYDNSKIYNGVTITINEDGSITLNGKPTGTIFLQLLGRAHGDAPSGFILEKGSYAIVCNYYDSLFQIRIGTSEGTKPYRSYTQNGIYTIASAQDTYILIRIDSTHETFNNLTIKPMIVKVADDGTYPTEYQRYAKGNVELTDTINNVISDAYNPNTTYTVGQYCIYNNSLWRCLVQNVGQTPSEGTYWTATSVAKEMGFISYSTDEKIIGRWVDGKPIYRKYYNITTPSSNSVFDSSIKSEEITCILDVKGCVILGSGTMFPIQGNNNDTYATVFVTTGGVRFDGKTSTFSRPAQFYIDYVK